MVWMIWSEVSRKRRKIFTIFNKNLCFYAEFLAQNLKSMASNCDETFVGEELQYVREKLTEIVEGTEMIACHFALVQVKVK